MINKTVDGKYTLIALKEKGDIFQSYLAHYHLLGTQVMVDLIFPNQMRRDRAILIDLLERNLSLKSAHISRVYTWGQEEDYFFVINDYSHGILLRDLLRESGDLPPAQSLKILRDIIGGMAVAQGKGIYFLGINPHQIWVERTGDIKLLRPGYSFILESEDDRLFRELSVYWAPEVLRGEEGTRSSDVFSLGVLCRELLSSCFENTMLKNICLKACSFQPTDRHPSAKVFLEQIEEALGGHLPWRGILTMDKGLGERRAECAEENGLVGEKPIWLHSRQSFPCEHFPVNKSVSGTLSVEKTGDRPLRALSDPEENGDLTQAEDNSQGNYRGGTSWMNFRPNPARDLYETTPLGREESGDFRYTGNYNQESYRGKPSRVSNLQKMVSDLSGVHMEKTASSRGGRRGSALHIWKVTLLILVILFLCLAGIRFIGSSPKEPSSQLSEAIESAPIEDHMNLSMPDLTGLDSKEASRLMGEMGFKVEVLEEPSNVIPEGKIVLQEPRRGELLDAGDRVRIYVSTGPLQQKPDSP